ncbi:MAG: hypothetical protein QNJ88_12660 [Acidimicrobiia bacterium]|nr:hypothetical protein [Acidimicrobiia bacterium]
MPDPSNIPDGRELIRSMGWEALPYGCAALIRRATIRSTNVWSWLVLVPWAETDGKPWIDGTETYDRSLKSIDEQRDEVLGKIRDILDDRYGETVGRRAADDLIDRIFNGDD